MELSRRGFLGGLLAIVSAPAIVRVESLMTLPRPINILPITRLDVLYGNLHICPEWQIALDEYSEQILAPMAKRLEQIVADTVMYGNGASWITLEADGTGFLPKGAREQVPVIAPVRLSDLLRLREARGHQFT
jgi:hypothetical protein